MRMIWNKGHRIRASDKHLVYHFSVGMLLLVLVAVLLLLNIKQLMRTDWEHFGLLENGLTLSSYNLITILIATGVCALVAFLYYRFCYDNFKKLLHRQKLARMILENKWYEADTVQDSGFFTDLQSRSREKIVWFPKIYYQMEKGLLHIRCEITMGKYQDQLLRLEDKLESGLYCELTDKTLHDGYIEYTLLYDMIANRITIDEVRAENGCLRLMKNLVWEYDTLPHALIAGGTGGGKTYFLLTLIEALLHTNAVLYILDPKNSDLADLETVMGNVYHTKEEMIDCVNAFYEGMVQRSEEMKRHPNYKTGENYAYLGLPPCFLIFDEYVAFFEMLGTKESVSLLSQLKKIVMLGRQAGYFLIVACQRPDAKYFSDGIRDNFNFRVGLGRISELGYGMLFGSDVKKQFFQKRIKGRGYCDVGTSVISEFYTPLVPKGHDFLQIIGSLAQARQDGQRVGIVEKVMNDGSIGSTFNEGHLTVEGEDAYCIDINTDFRNGYKTRADASTRMSVDQISDVALSIEYVKQYTDSHSGISKNHAYLLRQLVVWQRLSVHLGWQCDNVRASYDEIPKATQDEVFSGAKAFVKENKGRYECGGYIYSGEGQELGQFWAKLNVGNAKLQKTSSNTSITDGNGNYSIAGATYGVFADKDCTKQLATLTTDKNGNTDVVEVKAGTVYIKELSAPAGYKVDKTVYSLKIEAGKTATLKVSDTPKVTDTLIELFKIDMETQKDNPQGNASLAGAEFTWKYYAGFYTKDNLPAEATRTWVTKTIAETDSDGTTHYITKLADAYKVSGDSFYMQDGKAVFPLGTLTVEETKAPNGYLLDGAYMQAGDKSEQIKGLYVTQITEDGDLAVLSGSNQFSVSDKVIRGGVKIQKRDLETGDTKPQGSATLKDTAFDIISLNDNSVLVEGKLYSKDNSYRY